MIDIKNCLIQLADQRPIFHSEADFQHALAWRIQKILPDAQIRLELPFTQLDKQSYLDIFVQIEDYRFGIELKYKTRFLTTNRNGEHFRLKNQSAQDLGRYDFLKDIQRLEYFSTVYDNCIGYAILLTNDSSYWKQPRSSDTVDREFRLSEGREIKGSMSWQGAAAGTMHTRENKIKIGGNYLVDWEDYSNIDAKSYGRFRYLMVQVQ